MLFIESTQFERQRAKHLTSEEFRVLQTEIIERPEKGKLIRGSGGLRKIRVAAKGQGKSRGARVVYYHQVSRNVVYLLDLYTKSDKADLSPKELREVKKRLEE